MSRKALCLVLLAAILVGVLIAGTPVNQDSSPEAARAGIHLTVPPTARAAAHSAVDRVLPLTLLLLIVLAMGAVGASGDDRRSPRVGSLSRSQLLLRSSARRGPPVVA